MKEHMSRISKDQYYINIAKAVAQRGTCKRRNYGAVIVKNDAIVSTGYTGSPRGCDNCVDLATDCPRKMAAQYSGYEVCPSVHAEMNAIINIGRSLLEGSTLYLVGIPNEECMTREAEPCNICRKMIMNSGIDRIVIEALDESIKEITI